MLLSTQVGTGISSRPAFLTPLLIAARPFGMVESGLSRDCLGCVPIVFLGCLGYTADARLRQLCFSIAGLDDFEAKETQTLVDCIHGAYPKHHRKTH